MAHDPDLTTTSGVLSDAFGKPSEASGNPLMPLVQELLKDSNLLTSRRYLSIQASTGLEPAFE
jgi:hypothetical protein